MQKWNCDEGDFIQLRDKLQQCFNQEKLGEISVILAGIWKRRNMAVFEDKFDSPNKVVQKALLNLKNFKDVDDAIVEPQTQGICTRRGVKWMPSTTDFTKVNFDAAIDQAEKKMGIGVVGRNFKGELLFSVYAVKMFIGPVDLAEANALWRAMEICSDLNNQQFQFEGDAPKVITDICKKGATSS